MGESRICNYCWNLDMEILITIHDILWIEHATNISQNILKINKLSIYALIPHIRRPCFDIPPLLHAYHHPNPYKILTNPLRISQHSHKAIPPLNLPQPQIQTLSHHETNFLANFILISNLPSQ